MKKIILLFLLGQAIYLSSFGQKSSNNKQLYESVIENNKSSQVSRVLLLDNYLDGRNHTWEVNTEMTLAELLSKTFPVLDSIGMKVPKVEKSTLLTKSKKYKAGKTMPLKNADFVTTDSEAFGNLQANLMVVTSDAREDEIEALRLRRIEKIKEATSAEKAKIFGLSEPFFYNNNKNAFLILLIIEPGSNNFFVCNYALKGSKWISTNDKVLIYSERN